MSLRPTIFPAVVARLQRYGGRTPLVSSGKDNAVFAMPAGVLLRVQQAEKKNWGLQMAACTGSTAHLAKLTRVTGALRELAETFFPTEQAFYRKFGLQFIEPELREGHDEVERAAENALPALVTAQDIRGELHAHSTSSDGSDSIEDMGEAARERGYEYIGITDHSQSQDRARRNGGGFVGADSIYRQAERPPARILRPECHLKWISLADGSLRLSGRALTRTGLYRLLDSFPLRP